MSRQIGFSKSSTAIVTRPKRIGRFSTDWIEEATETTFTKQGEPCAWWVARTDVTSEASHLIPECCAACMDRGACNHADIQAHKKGEHDKQPSSVCTLCPMSDECNYDDHVSCADDRCSCGCHATHT